MLRAFVLALRHDTGRDMRDSDSGFRLLNVLAAGTGGTVHVDTEVGRIDFDLNRVITSGYT